MIKITKDQLIKMKACQAGIDWFTSRRIRSLKSLIPALLKDNHREYAGWLLSRLLTHSQQVQWAINSAELVIEIFNRQYPNDKRPSRAIQAAKDYLAGKITAYAADAAAYAAAYAAVSAAAYAAAAAANAAYAAVSAAAAYAAAANAAYAAAYAADNVHTEQKIYGYALTLLGE